MYEAGGGGHSNNNIYTNIVIYHICTRRPEGGGGGGHSNAILSCMFVKNEIFFSKKRGVPGPSFRCNIC